MLSTFDVVAEPNRRRILDLLCTEERSVSELVERLELSQPTVSKHLRVLRQARLVHSQVSAQRRLYRLSPLPLLELEAWLEPYRRFWNERLDALGRHLDQRAAAAARATAEPAAAAPRRSRQRVSSPPGPDSPSPARRAITRKKS